MAKNFGGFGGNMQNLMKQAQLMQQKLLEAQKELEEAEIVGTAGGDMVTITMNGKKVVLGVSIKKEAVDPDDIEMLEDLIMAAFADAAKKVDELTEEKMGPLGGGVGGLF
jgi:DNA-binding YbaB/EbfC family protein